MSDADQVDERPPSPDDIQSPNEESTSSSELTPEELEALEGELVDERPIQPGARALRAVQALTLHRGPMPSEQWLTVVEQLEQGTTRRIVDDFVEERKHQRTMQTEALTIDRENFQSFQRYQHLQLFAAWSVVALIAAGGIVLIAVGHSIAGLVALVAELAILAGVFVGRQVIQSKSDGTVAPPT